MFKLEYKQVSGTAERTQACHECPMSQADAEIKPRHTQNGIMTTQGEGAQAKKLTINKTKHHKNGKMAASGCL